MGDFMALNLVSLTKDTSRMEAKYIYNKIPLHKSPSPSGEWVLPSHANICHVVRL